MPWSDEPGGGFTAPGVTPWLAFGDLAAHNVADQRADPASTLHLVRDLIALRRATPDLTAGAYATLPAPAGAWAWPRGDGHAVAVNLSDAPVTVDAVAGRIAIGDRPGPRRRGVDGLALGPWAAAVVAR